MVDIEKQNIDLPLLDDNKYYDTFFLIGNGRLDEIK